MVILKESKPDTVIYFARVAHPFFSEIEYFFAILLIPELSKLGFK